MTKYETALLELILVAGLGVCLLIATIVIKIIQKRRIVACTAKTAGRVIKYTYQGDGRVRPCVEFYVDGKAYTTKMRFNGYKQIRSSAPLEGDMWEDEKHYLHTRIGAVFLIEQAAGKLWPLGSALNVYYAPDRPKVNYVERPVSSGFLTIAFTIAGLFLIVLGIAMFFVVKNG